jgi:hypothetical protein
MRFLPSVASGKAVRRAEMVAETLGFLTFSPCLFVSYHFPKIISTYSRRQGRAAARPSYPAAQQRGK